MRGYKTHETQNASEQIVSMPVHLHDHTADQASVVSDLQQGEMGHLSNITRNQPSPYHAHHPQVEHETHQPEENVFGSLIGGLGGPLLRGVLGGASDTASTFSTTGDNLISNVIEGIGAGDIAGGVTDMLEGVGLEGGLEGAASLLAFL